MRFRHHRETLADALETTVEVGSRAGLLEYLSTHYKHQLEDGDLQIKHQRYDERCGWDSHIVCLKNFEMSPGRWFFGLMPHDYFGAVGHSDGMG